MIKTTSDIYIHKIIGPDINHYTLIPPPVYELSWSTGELHSEIRPKRKRIEYLSQLLADMEQNDPDYEVTKSKLRRERDRMKQFVEFNDSPVLGYNDIFDLI